jgi:hypothetical protein
MKECLPCIYPIPSAPNGTVARSARPKAPPEMDGFRDPATWLG